MNDVDSADAPATLIEDAGALEALAERVREVDLLALDTEANSLHAYREKACVLQATLDGENFIVDLVAISDLSSLADAMDREDLEVVFHGGDYDIALLSREHDFRFHRVFDTMIAAMLLDEEKIGLADLVRNAFEVELDKRYQKADWRARPLTPDQIDYLYRDTAYLPELRRQLLERLEAEDLVEEAEIEFRRLAARRGKPVVFDPEGWRSMKGAGRLDATGRAILSHLWLWRDEVAEQKDRPPFKVFPPRLMVDLAVKPPQRLRHPDDLREVPQGLRRRVGKDILHALRDAYDDVDADRAPEKETRPKPTPEERAESKRMRDCEDRIRQWRKKEAERRKVPNLVVLPNRGMLWMVRELPEDAEAIAACPDIGPKRAALYAEAWLPLLHDD